MLLAWHREHALRAPWRESGDPYQALVAAVMAQQTQMSRVLPSYERFMASFPTLKSLATASVADVIRVWAGMGYNQRAVRLHRAARQIAATGWPRHAGDLIEIDGIGPFTAAIIASFAFGEPAACVDTNVRRVLGRLAGVEGIDGKQLQALADSSITGYAPAQWNQALMDYGARVCTVRPKCSECAVSAWCQTYGDQARTPLRVADTRATYDSKRARRVAKREAPFEGSARYYRGRVVDVLRRLAPGDTVALDALPALVSAGGAEADAGMVCDLVRALERAGLARVHDSRVSLPE